MLWVHATLLESVPLLHELLVSPLSAAEHDAYCAEAAPIAIALGAPAADVPRTRAAVRSYIDATYRSGVIAVGTQATALARAVMLPPVARVVLPAAWLNELVTVGLLPDHVRAQYGFRWTPARARALPIALRTIRLLRRGTPDRLAVEGRASARLRGRARVCRRPSEVGAIVLGYTRMFVPPRGLRCTATSCTEPRGHLRKWRNWQTR